MPSSGTIARPWKQIARYDYLNYSTSLKTPSRTRGIPPRWTHNHDPRRPMTFTVALTPFLTHSL